MHEISITRRIAAEAIGLLKLRRQAPTQETPAANHTENGAAYLAYLKGLGFLTRFDKESDLRATTTFPIPISNSRAGIKHSCTGELL